VRKPLATCRRHSRTPRRGRFRILQDAVSRSRPCRCSRLERGGCAAKELSAMTHQNHSDKPAIGSDPPEKWFSFLGLVIVRRTDLLAAVAFTLSISTISYQAWQFSEAPIPRFFSGHAVCYFDRYANGIIATRLAGQISFTNKGDTGHNAIIRDVSATITLGPRTINENWLSFAAVTRRDTALSLDIKERPSGRRERGSASSYMITFSRERRTAGCRSGPKLQSGR